MPLLAADVGIAGVSGRFARSMYGDRSSPADGQEHVLPPASGTGQALRTSEIDPNYLAEIARVQDLLRAAARKGVEEPLFATTFADAASNPREVASNHARRTLAPTGAAEVKGRIRTSSRMANETAFPLDYVGLRSAFVRSALDVDALADLLSDGWAAGYRATPAGEVELVEVEQGKLTYLFDIAYARVLGVLRNLSASERRIPHCAHARLPALSDGTSVSARPPGRAHRRRRDGHQPRPTRRGTQCQRRLARLERWAQARPGAFLAVEVSYDDDSQTPAGFVYLVAAERELRYERFANR
jgi:hypothetical protein